MMRALTLTQPWAGLVASGIKLVENRPRSMIKREDFGKPFAIHASREIDASVYDRIAAIHTVPCFRDWYRLSRDRIVASPCRSIFRMSGATSAVIGVATIERAVIGLPDGRAGDAFDHGKPVDLGDQHRWFFGPIGYVLRDAIALPEPVPCRGWQGFWTLPDDVEATVRAQLQGVSP